MEKEKLKSVIESILFVSGEPIKVSKIAKVAKVKNAEIEESINELRVDFENRGLAIVKKDDRVQMTTSSENSEIVSDLVKSEIQESLSKAALETLSIIAYRGPISRINVEAIRGVNCSFTIRTLLMRGLLEREDNPADNRSYLYKVSFNFLKKLGIDDVKKLPDYETLSKDNRIESVVNEN